MKKLIMVAIAMMAMFSYSNEVGVVSEEDAFAMNVLYGSQASTNLVIAYEIVEARVVPCACPDGYYGCLVNHMRNEHVKRYVKASEFVMSDGPEGKLVVYIDECSMKKYMDKKICPIVLYEDQRHPVGFVDVDMVLEIKHRNGAS